MKCIDWARQNLPEGVELVDDMDRCDVFVSVLYDTIITKGFISKRECFNFHPGILPWYRGSGAYSWAIMNGEMESGVTLHRIDEDIDHGNVISILRFPIWKDDTAESVFERAEESIFNMFKYWLPLILSGDFIAMPQIEGRIYYRKDLDKAKDLTRFVRALTFRGKESAYFYNSKGEKIYLEYNAAS